MAGIQISTEPVAEPLSLQEVKDYLRLDDNIDERMLRALIQTVRQFCEQHTGRKLMTQTITQYIDGYDETITPLWEGTRTAPDLPIYKNFIELSFAPLQSVTSVKTYDDSDTATTMATSKYYVDSVRELPRVVLRKGETFPNALRVANAIEIIYDVGYSTAYTIPEALKVGMLQHLAHLYEHRGDMYEAKNAYPPMLRSLYAPYVIHKGLGSSTLMAI